MRTIKILVAFFIATFIPGCVVPSLHPLFTEEDLVFEPALVGAWGDGGDTWSFQKSGDNAYRLTVTEEGKSGEFVAALGLLGKYLFLDIYPEEPEINANDFYKFHLIPAHSFLRIWIEGDVLRLAMLDLDWLDDMIKQRRINIAHERMDDLIVLTASTKALQEFVLKYAEDAEAFGEPGVWHRLTEEVAREMPLKFATAQQENLYDEAIERFQKQVVDAYMNLGKAYRERKAVKDAATAYQMAFDLTAKRRTVGAAPRARPQRILGTLWNLFAENDAYEDAVATFRGTTNVNPDEPLSYELLGDAYQKLEDRTGADAAYERWFELQKGALDVSDNKYEERLRKLQLMRYFKQIAPQKDWRKTGVVWANLGNPDDENGLKNSFNTVFGDGAVKVVTKAKEVARQVEFDEGGRYIYFNVDDDFIYGEMSDVWLAVEYFDSGENRSFHLQYDSFEALYKSAETIKTKDTQRWKFHIYHIPGAFFGNGQNGGSDFRFDMHAGAKRSSGKDIALNRIFVFSTYGLVTCSVIPPW